jgi:hypothetical protein
LFDRQGIALLWHHIRWHYQDRGKQKENWRNCQAGMIELFDLLPVSLKFHGTSMSIFLFFFILAAIAWHSFSARQCYNCLCRASKFTKLSARTENT